VDTLGSWPGELVAVLRPSSPCSAVARACPALVGRRSGEAKGNRAWQMEEFLLAYARCVYPRPLVRGPSGMRWCGRVLRGVHERVRQGGPVATDEVMTGLRAGFPVRRRRRGST